MNTTSSIDQLLEDELSAMETYECLLEKFKLPGGHFVSVSLKPIYNDHENAVSSLKTKTQQQDSPSIKSSEVWGNIEELVLKHPEFVGKKAAIEDLLEGEKKIEVDYLQVLENANLNADVRKLIEDKLLPYQQDHIVSLDRMITVLAA